MCAASPPLPRCVVEIQRLIDRTDAISGHSISVSGTGLASNDALGGALLGRWVMRLIGLAQGGGATLWLAMRHAGTLASIGTHDIG